MVINQQKNKQIIDEWGTSTMDTLRRIQRKQREEEEDAKMQRTIKTAAVIGGVVGGLMVLKWLLK